MAVLDTDTFARTVSAGFGTASDGAMWTQQVGHSTSVSVGSGKGLVAYDAGARDLLTLGSTTTADGEVLARFTPQSSTDYIGFVVRYGDASDYTRITLHGAKFVSVESVVSGVTTSYNVSNSFFYTNGKAYWIRARFIGQTYWVKVWADGTNEPTSWLGTITNTAGPTTAGKYGVYMLSGVSGNTLNVDSLSFLDSASPHVFDAGLGSEGLLLAVLLGLVDGGSGAETFAVNKELLTLVFTLRDGAVRLRTRDGLAAFANRDGLARLRLR